MKVKPHNNPTNKVCDALKKDIVIAHRGSTYWTPEETEPAYRWARNIGADYLELDLQLTKDGFLVAIHDDNLKRTTNIKKIFPKKEQSSVNDFTLKELRSLDAGSWFNKENSKQARKSFIGLKIMTFKDIVKIAEGYRIKKENKIPVKELLKGKWNGNYTYEIDPKDSGNRPGVYVETKHPKLQIEKVLAKELTALGWNINDKPKKIETFQNKVNIANTKARVILQSFSPESIQKLEKHLPNIPKCFLLWHPKINGNLKKKYVEAINFAIINNVSIMGPSIAGKPNNYSELAATWMTQLLHNSGLLIHPYTFDTPEQLNEYANRVDGLFTNRADLTLEYYNRKNDKSPSEILDELRY